MSRGRKKFLIPRERITVYIEEPTLAKLRLLTFDPVRQQPRHGAITDLVNSLLKQYLDRLGTEGESA